MVLAADPEIEIVGEASDGREGVRQARRLEPDVVLIDLQMPVMDGVAATAELCRLPSPPAVLVLTTFHVDEYVVGALRAGATGYLLKDTDPHDWRVRCTPRPPETPCSRRPSPRRCWTGCASRTGWWNAARRRAAGWTR